MQRIDPPRVLATALLLACLCARADSADTPTEDSPMPEQEQALPVVSSAAAAAAHAGRQVFVRGIARDAKLGAVIVGEDLHVYCLVVGVWPAELNGQPVEVQGLLEQSLEFAAPGDGVGAGTDGPVWILRDCRLHPR